MKILLKQAKCSRNIFEVMSQYPGEPARPIAFIPHYELEREEDAYQAIISGKMVECELVMKGETMNECERRKCTFWAVDHCADEEEWEDEGGSPSCRYREGSRRSPLPVGVESGEVSDGYHTFNELYEFRKIYNAALFNEWAKQGKYSVHKSTKHFEGDECFGGGWFIVVAMLPSGQISNHYEIKDWDLFKVPEYEKALFEFDGHIAMDVIQRLKDCIWK